MPATQSDAFKQAAADVKNLKTKPGQDDLLQVRVNPLLATNHPANKLYYYSYTPTSSKALKTPRLKMLPHRVLSILSYVNLFCPSSDGY